MIATNIQAILETLAFIATFLLLPPLLIGIIRKTKARFQNRIGAPLLQPYFDLLKLLSKGETISKHTSWIFRSTAAINVSLLIILAFLAPWTSLRPFNLGADLFLVIYLLALTRFFTVLSALDAGSAFGGFGASREVTLALLVEPAVILCLAAIGSVSQTSDLGIAFSFDNVALINQPGLWFIAGCGLFLASLVELSRMPADDPTTHLELTMVHEAMILENSAANLALVEYAHFLKILILLGISSQCLLHAIPFFWHTNQLVLALFSIFSIMILAVSIAVIESVAVKLRWTKLPEFIAYSVAMSIFCVFIALSKNLN
ncbi:MAG: NADH-quinone oxidoreductase subunit H [Candidatus Melainabacteria bacterium]|nr:NADH-quinone oxidoreductase subunit H [Candidatus Melainabacteria bacterium]